MNVRTTRRRTLTVIAGERGVPGRGGLHLSGPAMGRPLHFPILGKDLPLFETTLERRHFVAANMLSHRDAIGLGPVRSERAHPRGA
jgi:hypothetical protein